MPEKAITIGRVSVVPKGVFDSSTTYSRLDIVSHDGSSYIAKKDVPVGTSLIDTTYWLQIAAKGSNADIQTITTAVEDWLSENITQPTTPVVDNTLSISGAVADAAKTGLMNASVYDNTITYNIGDFVNYNGALYKCKTQIINPEDWNAAHWIVTNTGMEISNLKNSLESTIINKNASGDIVTIGDAVGGMKAVRTVVACPPYQGGTGTPSAQNVRGIKGWNSLNVVQPGTNLIDIEHPYLVSAKVNGSEKKRYGFAVKGAGTYKLRAFATGSSEYFYAAVRAADGSFGMEQYFIAGSNKRDITVSVEDGGQLVLYFPTNNSAPDLARTVLESWKPVVVRSEVYPETYIPFDGSSYVVSYPPEAGSVVYGCDVDLTNGVLKVTHANIVSYAGEELPGAWLSSIDEYVDGGTPTAGAQVVYELAEPVVYPLTPVDIVMRDGVNTLWAYCGSIAIDYVASTKGYIDERDNRVKGILVPVLGGMVADTALTVGDYRIVGDVLYQVIADIAAGQALIVGTNVTPTTAGVNISRLDKRVKESPADIKHVFDFDWGDLDYQGAFVDRYARMATPDIQRFGYDIVIAKKNAYTSCWVDTFDDASGSNPRIVGIVNDSDDYLIRAGTYFRLLIYNPQDELSTRGDKCNNPIYNDFRAYSAPLSESLVRSGSYKDTYAYNRNVRSVCHRGASRLAPENTLPAFVIARRLGFDCVEADVAITHDGVPVILHDESIDRTSNGTGNIADLDYADIENLDFGAWFSAEYSGTKIPTLAELMQLARKIGLRVRLDINHTMTTEQLTNVCKVVIRNGMMGNTEFIGYNGTTLATVRAAVPTATLIYLVPTVTEQAVATALEQKTDLNDVHLETQNITETAVNLCADALIPLEYWPAGSQQAIMDLDPYVTVVTTEGIDKGVPLVAGYVLYKSIIS